MFQIFVFPVTSCITHLVSVPSIKNMWSVAIRHIVTVAESP